MSDVAQRTSGEVNSAGSGTLTACHLGACSYAAGLRLQEGLVRARAAGACGDLLLFPDHPSVLTVGRGRSEGGVKASPAFLEERGIEVFEVARGGDVTWHGPGQLIGYPICHLETQGRDVHRYLRSLEQALIDALKGFGVESGRSEGRTGVWSDGQKIASIGVAVRRWVTYHGFALNVEPDLGWFDLIHPCGLHDVRMTSVAERLGPASPALPLVRRSVAEAVARQLGFATLAWASADTISRLADVDEPRAASKIMVGFQGVRAGGAG